MHMEIVHVRLYKPRKYERVSVYFCLCKGIRRVFMKGLVPR